MSKVLALRSQEVQAEGTSLVDEAYQALKTAIRDNVFPPGHQAAEPEIARQLGMSRTPVHEAIIRLQEEGLVQVLSRRGILICPISVEDIREIYDVLIAVEGMAAALLAGLAGEAAPSAAEALERETAEMEQALEHGKLLDWAAADERFHQLLTERCGNRRLARVAATVRDQSHRARLFTLHLRALPTASAGEHRRITDAIRVGNVVEAEAAARAHRGRARDALLPLLAQCPSAKAPADLKLLQGVGRGAGSRRDGPWWRPRPGLPRNPWPTFGCGRAKRRSSQWPNHK